MLSYEDYWDTFDSYSEGVQTVFIGYEEFLETVTVNVVRNENEGGGSGEDSGDDGGDGPGGSGKDSGGDGGDEPGGSGDDSGGDGGNRIAGTGPRPNEELLAGSIVEIVTNEELLDIIFKYGRYELRPGDSFSVRVTEDGEAGGDGFLMRDGDSDAKCFTSGIVR